MRPVSLVINDQLVERLMPAAEQEAMTGVRWGDPWALFTPAYWLAQGWMAELDVKPVTHYRARGDAVHELVFCLLGGYGITAEMAHAAYERCLEAGLVERRDADAAAWTTVLQTRLTVGGRETHYRYPNQKAKFIAGAMAAIHSEPLRLDSGRALRDQLLVLKGVGYKTASWVARNILDCDDVAILDVHLIRAGQLCGFYSHTDRVEREYIRMESLFLEFCRVLRLRPAAMDCLMWDHMREAGDLPLKMLASAQSARTDHPKKRSTLETVQLSPPA